MAAVRDAAVKRWALTFNNYSVREYDELIASLRPISEYFILGKEIAPNTNTKHIQGFIVLKKRQRFATLKSKLNTRIHLEPARASVKHNVTYCSKGGDFVTFGKEPAGNGGSTQVDMPRTRETIAREFKSQLDKNGIRGMSAFAEEFPATWYFHGPTMLQSWVLAHPEIERPTIEVAWFWGPPGTGKSALARHILPKAYMKDSCTKWWHGYMFERTCILDDFAPRHIDINHLLKWFDRYRNKVETKGGMVPLHVTQFIITSNMHPTELYAGEHQLPALMRRLSIVKEFDKAYLPIVLQQINECQSLVHRVD